MIYTLDHLQQAIAANPEVWRPLVFTNGCFDLIHVGHVRYLETAQKLGKTLVIGLNSDDSVRQIKTPKAGFPSRPLVPENQRAEVLAALRSVNGVVLFSETTANRLIEALKPEIYVKGGDYSVESLPESSSVMSYGGQIKLVQVEVPTSTTGIIERILMGHSPTQKIVPGVTKR
ncbi:MAG: adenylyltransferase/cytidyltransferase family protein [Microcystaceae cyanobacterium]